MPEIDTAARIVLTTAASLDEARRMGRTLVEERLAACATLAPAVESIYRWQGEIETASEVLLILKTAADQVASLQTRLLQIHSYETPEFLVLPVEWGSPGYLEWLHENLGAS
jgi:periplasmic divalent cation tolerance protein